MQKTDIIKSLGAGEKITQSELDNLHQEEAARFHELRGLIKGCVADVKNSPDESSASLALKKLADTYKDNQIKVTSGVFFRDIGEKLNDPAFRSTIYEYISDLLVNGCISLEKTHRVNIQERIISERSENDTFGFDTKVEARSISLNVGYFYIMVKSGIYSEYVDLSMSFFDKSEWDILIFESLYNAALQNDEFKIASLAAIAKKCEATIGCSEHGVDVWTALASAIAGPEMYGLATKEQRKRISNIAETMEKYGIGAASKVYENPGRGIETLIRNGFVEVVEIAGLDRVNSLDYTNLRGDSLSRIASNVKNSVNWFLVKQDGLLDYANATLKEIDRLANNLTQARPNDVRMAVNDDPNINFDTF